MILDWLPWRSSTHSEGSENGGKPPKPEAEVCVEGQALTRGVATVHYRNGDIEEIECYGIKKRGDDRVTFYTNYYWRVSSFPDGNDIRAEYDLRHINYETLEREPVFEVCETEVYRLSYLIDYEYTDYGWIHKAKKWRELIDPDSLSYECVAVAEDPDEVDRILEEEVDG